MKMQTRLNQAGDSSELVPDQGIVRAQGLFALMQLAQRGVGSQLRQHRSLVGAGPMKRLHLLEMSHTLFRREQAPVQAREQLNLFSWSVFFMDF
jgi:hypothetical protein